MENLKQSLPLYCAGPIQSFLPFIEQKDIVLIDEVQFPSHAAYRNRIEFVGISGKQIFSIPLQASSRKANYKLVELSYQEHWQNQLLNALRTSYGKSPFYEYYDYRFIEVIRKDHQYLWDFNMELLNLILKCLKIDSPVTVAQGEIIADENLGGPLTDPYYQVFAQENGFVGGLSILDLLFNEGVDAYAYLQSMKK
jgi:hypothetical protein